MNNECELNRRDFREKVPFFNKNLLKFFLIFAFLIGGIWFIVANPNIDFADPTPDDGNLTTNDWVFVNVSSSSSENLSTFLNWNNTLLAWWNFNFTNSTGVFDNSSNNNFGIFNGGLGVSNGVNGVFGGAYEFDGDDDYLLVVNDSSLEPESLLTFSVWVKRNNNGSTQQIFSKKDSGSWRSYQFTIQEEKMRFIMQNQSGGDYPDWIGSTILYPDQWYHLVVVWENTTGVEGDVKMYINGQSETIGTYVASGHSSSFTIGYNSSEPLYIGQRDDGLYNFNGSMDEVMIFGRALSSGEVLSLYNSTAYSRNFTSLSQAEYSFKAYSQDNNGSINSTETRTITVAPPSSISISYPLEYILFQRHNSTTGEVKIYGVYGGTPPSIEASFNGGSWTEIDSSPSGGVFSGSFNASVGQGNVSVRFTGNSTVNDTVVNVSIGDLYVIAGQSNAEGRGTNPQYLNSSNEYLATVYREDDAWTLANDPIDTETSSGTSFPLLADYIIQNQSIPVSFISTAAGGTSISVWQKGQTQYDNMYNQINEATNGTMRVKTVLYHQGETDAYPNYGLLGNYSYYKGNLSDFASNFLSDTSVAEKIIVAQIGELASSVEERSRLSADNIRKAQLDSWDENVNISAGPVLYDIGHLSDGVHFVTDSQLQELADRWWASVGKAIYNVGEERGPIINNVTFDEGDNDTIILNFTEDSLPIKIEYWNGTSSSLALGFSFYLGNGTFINNTHISSTEVINQNQLRINLTLNITINANISLGSFNDGVGNPIVRDSSTYSLPAETFYNQTIYMIPAEDTTAPTITVLSPSNTTYTDSTVFFNATVNETISMWIVNYNGTNVTSFTINTSLDVEDGFHNLFFYGNDSSGNMGLNNSVSFTMDTTSPSVTISSPTSGQLVTSSSLSLSATTNENSTCNYSTDAGVTNSSLTANSTGTGHIGTLSSLTDGDYTLNVYCADILGNANNTMRVSFSVSIPVTTTPSTSGGGGGGPSSGNPTYTVTESRLEAGYSKEIGISSRFKFTIEEEHYLTLDEVTENTASINVSSISQFATLSVGDSRRFDVTDDIFYDLRVTLNSVNVTALKANFSLLKINESITAETIAEEQEKEVGENVGVNDEAKEIKISFWKKIGNFFERLGDWIVFWR